MGTNIDNTKYDSSYVCIKLCYSGIPILLLVAMLLIHLYHPHIKFSEILLSSSDNDGDL